VLTGKATQTCKAYPNGYTLLSLVQGESLELSPFDHAFLLERSLIETKPVKIEIETKPLIKKVSKKSAK